MTKTVLIGLLSSILMGCLAVITIILLHCFIDWEWKLPDSGTMRMFFILGAIWDKWNFIKELIK